MSTIKSAEMDTFEVIDLLKAKLRKAAAEGKLDKMQINNLKPASLKVETNKKVKWIPKSLRPKEDHTKPQPLLADRQVPEGHVESCMRRFEEARNQGRLSHLSEAQIKKLEGEIRATASDPSKTAEVEEFFRSIFIEDE